MSWAVGDNSQGRDIGYTVHKTETPVAVDAEGDMCCFIIQPLTAES